jgi:putative serine protease PepD
MTNPMTDGTTGSDGYRASEPTDSPQPDAGSPGQPAYPDHGHEYVAGGPAHDAAATAPLPQHAATQHPATHYGTPTGAGEPTADYGYGAYPSYGSYGYHEPVGYPTQTLPPHPPSGGGPAGPTGPASAPATGAPKRRRRAGVVALVAAACLVGGAAGGVAGAELADPSTTVVQSAAPDTSDDDASGQSSPVSQITGSVQSAAAKIMPSVVVIEATGQAGGASGSGVVMDTDGNIVTNAHVVEAVRNPDITVTFSDGTEAEATIVGVDVSSDLAVIKVSGVSDLKPATFADSSALQIGQAVLAVGAPLGLSGTVTQGIVSAVQRPVRTSSEDGSQSTVIDAIQTDAAINPGNSGGPLVNLAGEVVGINSAIATVGGSAGESGNIGVGFSIPSDDVTNIADQLVATGKAVHASLGVTVGESRNGDGPVLEQVQADSPAAKAGLQSGDVITKIGDRAVYDVDSLLAAVRDYQPGDQVTITLLRGGDEQTVTVTLGSREG